MQFLKIITGKWENVFSTFEQIKIAIRDILIL